MSTKDAPAPQETPPPLMEFSFFDAAKRRTLAEADVWDLFNLFTDQPSLIPQFLHELWRSRRERDIHQVAFLYPYARDIFIDRSPKNIAHMHIRGDVPFGTCETFFRETITLVAKGEWSLELEEEFTDSEHKLIEDSIATVMNLSQQISAGFM